MNKMIPAPWELKGDAYVMFFKFPKHFILEHGCLSDYDKERFIGGGPGCIIIANFKSSTAGPYQELLFLPGKVQSRGKKLYTISKAYVSTADSSENARRNWGIPKEIASFSITEVGKNIENIQITRDGTPILDITIQSSGLSFPVNTWFFPSKLAQHFEERDFLVRFRGKGMGRFAQNMKVDVNPEMFPHFAFYKHVSVMKISDFKLFLPEARIKK